MVSLKPHLINLNKIENTEKLFAQINHKRERTIKKDFTIFK